jgi:hypothetical protein
VSQAGVRESLGQVIAMFTQTQLLVLLTLNVSGRLDGAIRKDVGIT